MDKYDRETDEYLRSPQARADVAELLARYSLDRYPLGCDQTTRTGCWTIDERTAWRRVRYSAEMMSRAITVYCRFEAGSHVATDNGEAVAHLRLKTGLLTPIGLCEALGKLPDLGGATLTPSRMLLIDAIASVDLPDAICRVALAAHRLTCLELRRG